MNAVKQLFTFYLAFSSFLLLVQKKWKQRKRHFFAGIFQSATKNRLANSTASGLDFGALPRRSFRKENIRQRKTWGF